MRNLPPMEALSAFLLAAETGSMSAAAEVLGVTHGAVSRRIAAVEQWLGQPVLERGGRGVRLTDTGAHVARQTERALGSIEALGSQIRSGRRAEVIRISALPAFARLWLMPRLADLQSVNPGVLLDVITEHRLAQLNGRDTDIAIRFGDGGWAGVEARKLLDERVAPGARLDLAQRLRGVSAGALSQSMLIHDSDGANWTTWFRSQGVSYRPTGPQQRFVDYDMALQAAELGLGVVLVRLPLAQAVLSQGRIALLDFPPLAAERGHYLLTKPNEQRGSVRRLVDALVRAAGSEP